METPKTPPDLETLLDWLENRLSPTERDAVTAAIAAAEPGSGTAQDLRWLQAFLKLSESINLSRPPDYVRTALRDQFRQRQASRPIRQGFQRVVAALRPDPGLATAGLRSLSYTNSQQIYETEQAEIALNLLPQVNRHAILSGQIFPKDQTAPGSFSIQLLRDENEVGLVVSDEFGEFVFEAMPPGVYDLIISTDHFEAFIGPLTFNRA